MSSIKTKQKVIQGRGSKPSKGNLLGEGKKVLECSCSQHTEDNQPRLEHYKSRGRNVLSITLHLHHKSDETTGGCTLPKQGRKTRQKKDMRLETRNPRERGKGNQEWQQKKYTV